jgi:hypothetical protein
LSVTSAQEPQKRFLRWFDTRKTKAKDRRAIPVGISEYSCAYGDSAVIRALHPRRPAICRENRLRAIDTLIMF